MRRITLALSGLTAMAVVVLTTSTSAFALRFAPPPSGGPSGTSPVNAPTVVHHAGLGFWPVALIVVAAVVVVAGGVAVLRAARRPGPRPAVH